MLKRKKVGWILGNFRRGRHQRQVTLNLAEIFDSRWYLEAYPDVATSGLDAFEHYLRFGHAEQRAPNPLFNREWYLQTYPDIATAGVEPIFHYMSHGYREGRLPHPLFDGAWYLQQYADVRNANLNPLVHFTKFGAAEGRKPSLWFDPAWYLRQTSGGEPKANPIGHYLTDSSAARLSPIPLFDGSWYLEQNPDVRAAGVNPLQHYVTFGATEGRQPNLLFDVEWYARQAGNEARGNPLYHYMTLGAIKGLSPHPFFDGNWYARRYSDVSGSGMDPLSHYLAVGQGEGRSPHPSFDPLWYIQQPFSHGVDLKNALKHYLATGLPQGLRGSKEFQPSRVEAFEGTGNRSPAKPAVLMIMSQAGQGIQTHVHELCNSLLPNFNSVIMRFVEGGIVEIHDFASGKKTRFDSVYEADELVEALRNSNIIRINLHNLAQAFLPLLPRLKRNLKVPYDITLHDYSQLASDPDLAGSDDTFVGEDNVPGLGVSAGTALEDIIANADRTIAPSFEMANRLKQLIAIPNIVVAPHLSGLTKAEPYAPALRPGEVINVAVLGHLTARRGLQVLVRTARLIAETRAPIQLILVGTSDIDSKELSGLPISVAGDYVLGELPEILIDYNVHLIWYPSQVPDAFAHTLSEGLWVGLPLLVPNIGAYRERVNGRSWSFVEDWDSQPQRWLLAMESIRVQLLTRAPLAVSNSKSRERCQHFYPREYIREF